MILRERLIDDRDSALVCSIRPPGDGEILAKLASAIEQADIPRLLCHELKPLAAAASEITAHGQPVRLRVTGKRDGGKTCQSVDDGAEDTLGA